MNDKTKYEFLYEKYSQSLKKKKKKKKTKITIKWKNNPNNDICKGRHVIVLVDPGASARCNMLLM